MGRRRADLPGCLYARNGRWWWKVRLPGEPKHMARPLVPPGGSVATRDRRVAEEVARELLAQAAFRDRSGSPAVWDGTVGTLCRLYQQWAERYYVDPDGRPTGEAGNIRDALAHLLDYGAAMPVEEFTVADLDALRDRLIAATRETTDEGGKPLEVQTYSRSTVNARVAKIRAAFRWAAGPVGLVPASVAAALEMLPGLRPWKPSHTGLVARETAPVRQVAERVALATAEHATSMVAAMIRVQLWTGMRPGELCRMRPCDLDCLGDVWLYRPARHKTAHRGQERIVAIGPRAQKVLGPLLGPELDRPVFRSERSGGGPYTPAGYHEGVQCAIVKARRGEKDKRAELPHWTPNQLRHTAGTRARKAGGPEAARTVLGQKSLRATEVYAERDVDLAKRMARKIG